MTTTPKEAPIDLSALSGMTTLQLQHHWSRLGLRGQPPHFKQALVRGLQWHAQRDAHGGLDAEIGRRLRAAMRRASVGGSTRPSKPKPKRRDPVQLRSGTRLVRTWRGRRHEVTVLDDGKAFLYQSRTYASLSEIAREITGARWSGPRFFGLTKLKGAA